MSFLSEENDDEIDRFCSQILPIVEKIDRLRKTLPCTKRALAAVSHYEGEPPRKDIREPGNGMRMPSRCFAGWDLNSQHGYFGGSNARILN